MQKQKRKPHQRRQKQDTHVAPSTKQTNQNVENDKPRLDPELYAPLPQNHMTSAYNKAKIHRKMRNGVLDIKRLSEITGIEEAEILPIFIEFKSDK